MGEKKKKNQCSYFKSFILPSRNIGKDNIQKTNTVRWEKKKMFHDLKNENHLVWKLPQGN